MKVQMKVPLSGTRDGKEWPQVGGEVNLPKDEAVALCSAGLAVPVAEKDADVEQREEPVEVTPEDPKVNKRDADRSAKAATKRATQAEEKSAK